MATAVAPKKTAVPPKKKVEAKKPGDKKPALREVAKISTKKVARLRAGLKEALKDAKEGALTLKGFRTIIEAGAATAFGKKGMALAERLAKAQAEAEEPKSQLSDLIIDLQQDIGQLASQLGMGDGPEDEEEEEDEDEQGVAPDMGGGVSPGAMAEDEDEDEEEAERAAEGEDEEEGERAAEGEDEDEEEGERAAEGEDEEESEVRASEDEDEEEAEGRTDESEDEEEGERATEGEDEEEGERAAEGEDEDEEEGEGYADEDENGGAMGMDDGAAPAAKTPAQTRLKFACAKCGETNVVAPPKGYTVARMGEKEAAGMSKLPGTMAAESQAIRHTADRFRRILSAKEGRFLATNKKMARIMRENITLKAENMAMKRVTEAKKVLREHKIPPRVLSASNLLAFEPHQWLTQIKAAKEAMRAASARESAMFQRGGAPAGGGVGRGKDGAKDSSVVAIEAFKESYQRNASR